MNQKSRLTTAAEIAGIASVVIAYLAFAYQIGWWTFDARVTPTPIQSAGVSTSTVVPTAVSTLAPASAPIPTNTSRPTATFTPKPTGTPRPTLIPTLGIVSTKISPIDGATMVYVPAGEFLMGNTDNDRDAESVEKPQHWVYLDAFWIDKFEVTNTRYAMCLNTGKCSSPHRTDSKTRPAYFGFAQYNNYPIIWVNWEQAKTYCEWAGKRLPTEAEWEKAASWDEGKKEKRIYPWGNTFDKNILNSREGGKGDTTAVGIYTNGTSPYGASDMAGNVWEWVADWYDENYYLSSPRNNPLGPSSGPAHIIRGGTWYGERWYTRTAYRGRNSATDPAGFDGIGIRCAQ